MSTSTDVDRLAKMFPRLAGGIYTALDILPDKVVVLVAGHMLDNTQTQRNVLNRMFYRHPTNKDRVFLNTALYPGR